MGGTSRPGRAPGPLFRLFEEEIGDLDPGFDENGVLFGSFNVVGGGQTGSDTLAPLAPGTGVATQRIHSGEVVTVDGSAGTVTPV